MNANVPPPDCSRRTHRVLAAAVALAALLSPLRSADAGKTTELQDALRRGDATTWRALLAAKPDLEARDAHGNTALHLAALQGDADAVEAMLENGANATAINDAGATPLHYGTSSERIVIALLAHGARVDAVSKVGVTPLAAAVARPDSFAIARRLIAAGAQVDDRRAARTGPLRGASVLSIAIGAGNRRTIALLLDNGANVNPAEGTSPLCTAAFVGDVETTRLLLARGAEVNHRSEFAGSALNFALHAQHHEVARVLLEHGADVNIRTTAGHGTPAIVLSAYNDTGDATMARLLLARGADINAANDYGETALSYALKRGPATPLVKYLEASGATPPSLIRTERAKAVPSRDLPADAAGHAILLRASAQRAVELLQRNSTAFLENGFVQRAQCVSCHQQSLPAVAFGLARERGLRVNEVELGRQLHATIAQRTRQAENAREMDEPTPNAMVTLGFDLDGLHALHYPADDVTDSLTRYLIGIQHADGSWPSYVRRPPIEDGQIVAAAWSIRALQLYPPTGAAAAAGRAVDRARRWLAAQPTRTSNERVFQLLGLAWAGENPNRLKPFVEKLFATQRRDGGWAQVPALPSDAWATGSALVALHKAGIATAHPAYQRGVDFLLRTQFDDGSWLVRSRTWPFQPHFDGQFPHGKDQWISAAGTAWATIALLLTVAPEVEAARLPEAPQLIARFTSEEHLPRAKRATTATDGKPAPASPAQTVSFARDIHPIIERSCANCHTGDKVRGDFSFASRAALLKGGQSGDPAIVPGRSGESPLVRYVSDQIEDLEMPPLAKREKYPALTANEIELLRAWIDSGAEWDKSQ